MLTAQSAAECSANCTKCVDAVADAFAEAPSAVAESGWTSVGCLLSRKCEELHQETVEVLADGHGGDVAPDAAPDGAIDMGGSMWLTDEQSDVVDEDDHDVKESEELEELEEMITNMNAVWKQMLKIKKLMEGVESAMPWHNLNSLDDSIKKLKKRDGSE